jgi:hypothetical protein
MPITLIFGGSQLLFGTSRCSCKSIRRFIVGFHALSFITNEHARRFAMGEIMSRTEKRAEIVAEYDCPQTQAPGLILCRRGRVLGESSMIYSRLTIRAQSVDFEG